MALTVLSSTFTKVGRVVYVCFLVTVLKKKKKDHFPCIIIDGFVCSYGNTLTDHYRYLKSVCLL